MVVGAPTEDSMASGVNGDLEDDSVMASGAAYVFRHVGNEWKFEAYVKPALTVPAGYFGFSVAVSGARIAVGAPNTRLCSVGDTGGAQRGSVHVFSEKDGNWVPEGCLSPHATGRGDLFGFRVDMLDSRLVVGAPWDSTDSNGTMPDSATTFSGAAYLFARVDSEPWYEERFIKTPNATIGDVFGFTAALVPGLLVVGAPQQSSAAPDSNALVVNDAPFSGAAYVFDLPPVVSRSSPVSAASPP